jgi:hypothetical protein
MNNIAKVIKNPMSLKGIKSPSFDACMAALMQDGMVIEHIPVNIFTRVEYYHMCETAVYQNPKAFTLIRKDRLIWHSLNSLYFNTVKKNGFALRWIKEQTPELCLEAIQQNSKAIKYVDKAMCDSTTSCCYDLLKKAAEEALAKEQQDRKFGIGRLPRSKKNSEKEINLRNLKRQTEAICLKAVQQDGLQLKYVWKQTREICCAALRQNGDAMNYIRDIDFRQFIAHYMFHYCFEKIADEFSELAYLFAVLAVRKCPENLKIKNKKPVSVQYYKDCINEINVTPYNIKFIKPEFLNTEQYKKLCINAIKKMPSVLKHIINKVNITSEQYFSICLETLHAVKPFYIKGCISYIDTTRISRDDYYCLIKAVIKLISEDLSDDFMEVIDGKKLGNQYYFTIFRILMNKFDCALGHIKPQFLSKKQYKELCIIGIRKTKSEIRYVDKQKLGNTNYIEICKIAIKESGSFLYDLDVFSPDLLKLALRNGGGLKYIKQQNYKQCLSVLKKNDRELRFVRSEQFSEKQYFNLSKTAINNNANSLEFLDDKKINLIHYVELCTLAMKSYPGRIEFINPINIPILLYQKWCRKAVCSNSYFLNFIPFSEQYFDLCLIAAKKGIDILSNVKYLRFSKNKFNLICKEAKRHTKKIKEKKLPKNKDTFYLS